MRQHCTSLVVAHPVKGTNRHRSSHSAPFDLPFLTRPLSFCCPRTQDLGLIRCRSKVPRPRPLKSTHAPFPCPPPPFLPAPRNTKASPKRKRQGRHGEFKREPTLRCREYTREPERERGRERRKPHKGIDLEGETKRQRQRDAERSVGHSQRSQKV